jgi:ribosomal protein S18 acetylase RimI-like enzyme
MLPHRAAILPASQHVLRLRRYEQSDAAVVLRLHHEGMHQAGAHAGDGPWDDDLVTIEATYLQAGGEFLVGELDGEVVAIGALRRIDDPTAEIKRMRVDAGVQRRGFARRLLAALEQRARELGFTRLTLDTTVQQLPARRLYESAGYRETGRARDPRGFELVLYEKRLP